jgi:beta-galactosidase
MKRIKFTLEGAGEIVGEIVATDNGDPTNLDPFPSHERPAFNGLCLAIIRAKAGQPGTITLHARAEGLTEANVEIRTIKTN